MQDIKNDIWYYYLCIMLTLQNDQGDRLLDTFEVSDNEKEAGYVL